MGRLATEQPYGGVVATICQGEFRVLIFYNYLTNCFTAERCYDCIMSMETEEYYGKTLPQVLRAEARTWEYEKKIHEREE